MSESSSSLLKITTPIGPYKATHLWNEIITHFNSEIKLGRHRRYMKTFDDCFVASEAVDLIHKFLTKKNEYSGVTRLQAIQLLRKLRSNDIFFDARGKKYDKEQFDDNNKLYRLKENNNNMKPLRRNTISGNSPDENSRSLCEARDLAKKASKTTAAGFRIPLSTRNSLLNLPLLSRSSCNKSVEKLKDKSLDIDDCKLTSRNDMKMSQLEVNNIWRNIVINKLQKLLSLNNLSDLIDVKEIKIENVIHNSSYVGKNGVVANVSKSENFPHWVVSAMRCLAHWPDKIDKGLPNYEGFERDVFNVVKDYFFTLDEPLLTCELYEMFAYIQDFLSTNPYRNSSPTDRDDSFPSFGNLSEIEPDFYKKEIRRINSTTKSKLKASIRHNLTDYSVNVQPPTPKFNLSNYSSYPVQYASITTIKKKVDMDDERKLCYSMNDVRETKRFNETLRSCPPPTPPLNNKNDDKYPLTNWRNVEKDIQTVLHNAMFSPTSHTPFAMSARYIENFHRKKNWRNEQQQRQPTPPPYRRLLPITSLEKRNPFANSVRVRIQDFRKIRKIGVSGLRVEDRNGGDDDANYFLKRSNSSPCIVTPPKQKKNKMIQALQIALLLLPPANRKKLHLLLRLLSKIIQNQTLNLVSDESIRNYLISTFAVCIIRPSKEKREDFETADAELVALLIDNYQSILAVPDNLKTQIEERIISFRRAKLKCDSDENNKMFCKQVTVEQYENQKLTSSQRALKDLLKGIIQDDKMSEKKKIKRLKEFKITYPEIYNEYSGISSDNVQTKPFFKRSLNIFKT